MLLLLKAWPGHCRPDCTTLHWCSLRPSCCCGARNRANMHKRHVYTNRARQ
jgi:hypothetical protein